MGLDLKPWEQYPKRANGKSMIRENYVEPWDFSDLNKFIVVDSAVWDLSKILKVDKWLHSAAFGLKAINWYCSADYKTRKEAQEAADRGNKYRASICDDIEICSDFVVMEVT